MADELDPDEIDALIAQQAAEAAGAAADDEKMVAVCWPCQRRACRSVNIARAGPTSSGWVTVRNRTVPCSPSRRSRERGIFRPAALDAMLAHHGVGGRQLWGALCLELWHQTFIDAS